MSRTSSGIALVLAVALGIGVAAEFADLNQAMLVAIALPTLAASTWLVAAFRATPSARAAAALAGGLALGLALGTIGEGTYLALHFARGGELNLESYDTQRATALALFVIHTLVGLAGGALVGAALAALFATRGLAVRRARPTLSGRTAVRPGEDATCPFALSPPPLQSLWRTAPSALDPNGRSYTDRETNPQNAPSRI